jgi:hypothetical protein
MADKYQLGQAYEGSWNVTRNSQTISVDIEFEIDDYAQGHIVSCKWGNEDFTLSFDEENEILNEIDGDVEDTDPEDDEDEDNLSDSQGD